MKEPQRAQLKLSLTPGLWMAKDLLKTSCHRDVMKFRSKYYEEIGAMKE